MQNGRTDESSEHEEDGDLADDDLGVGTVRRQLCKSHHNKRKLQSKSQNYMYRYIETLLLFYLKNPLLERQLLFLFNRLIEVIVALLIVQFLDLDIAHSSCLFVQRHNNLFALYSIRTFFFSQFDNLTF